MKIFGPSGRLPSAKSHDFSKAPQATIPRSAFKRDFVLKTTMNAGYLVPIYADEALPGDTFNLRSVLFGRLNTPIVPVMDNIYLTVHYFAVPIRLIWNNWQKFNGEQDNPEDSTDFLVPQMTAPASVGYAEQSLSDYFGLPTKVPDYTHSSLWHRAYNLIYNTYYRDENLQDSVVVDKGDGPDDPADYVLLKRGKRHDYFTSCLPWPQKGPAVGIGLAGDVPVWGPDYNHPYSVSDDIPRHMWTNSGLSSSGISGLGNDGPVAALNASFTSGPSGMSALASKDAYDNYVGSVNYVPPHADLSEASAITINSLRQAFQIQKLYERDARGGTRYIEILHSHFGVTSPDARLQRPEYLGGSTQRVNINPIAQTSGTTDESPLGNLAGFGTVLTSKPAFTKSFVEHCVVIGIASMTADLTYQQGLNRMFSRKTRWDFYWPALAHLGEQAVLQKEIYTDGTSDDDLVFGYQERFAEYRYKPSMITGLFRSNATNSLDFWHLSQDFQSAPQLNSDFIEENPPMDRVLAVEDQPDLILDVFFDFKCARPMPMYSVPGLVDHF